MTCTLRTPSIYAVSISSFFSPFLFPDPRASEEAGDGGLSAVRSPSSSDESLSFSNSSAARHANAQNDKSKTYSNLRATHCPTRPSLYLPQGQPCSRVAPRLKCTITTEQHLSLREATHVTVFVRLSQYVSCNPTHCPAHCACVDEGPSWCHFELN